MSLIADKISFQYSKQPLFSNLDFQLQTGEVVGLLGASGRGKTTLGRLLAGYEQPNQGHIKVNNQPLPKKGFVPVQLVSQHPEVAFDPKLKLRASLQSVGLSDDRNALFQSLEIKSNWLERFPHELSGGELQRLAIYRALHPDTKYLIADEITANLDSITQARIWKSIRSLMDTRPLGLLVITHNQKLAEKLCRRLVTIEQLMKNN